MNFSPLKKWFRNCAFWDRFASSWSRRKSRQRRRGRHDRLQLGLESLEERTLLSSNLDIQLLSAPNFIVDSNLQSGPTAAFLEARITNTGNTTLTNVFAYTGNHTANTPGVYPVATLTPAQQAAGLDDSFSFKQVGGPTDATRYVGTLAPGQSVVEYWLVSYPWTDDNGRPAYGARADTTDDLALHYDVWATATGDAGAAASGTATLRAEISAMANKIWPNTTSHVPAKIWPNTTSHVPAQYLAA